MDSKFGHVKSSEIPSGYDVDAYYTKFKRASTDETLDKMVDGAVKAVRSLNLSERVANIVLAEIVRAESRRQADFDAANGKLDVRVLGKRAAMITSSTMNLSPEKQMAAMLSSLKD